ncbi:uncharacterized protein DUF4032 [Prosthecobacter fusiformis]|uniref:Uncharacterized protein DUF4032 n=2 Tax=Prosthecobacter fusiformis TaxID=48464 RepID=A0A4R7RK57_9BACT|nr:uncharacterized protein DUF4032 [Prosthecobacter fusiformis]
MDGTRLRIPIMPAIPANAYIEFKAELEQILRHKWLMSEKENRDIGFERALNEWAQRHRGEWRCERNKKMSRTKG